GQLDAALSLDVGVSRRPRRGTSRLDAHPHVSGNALRQPAAAPDRRRAVDVLLRLRRGQADAAGARAVARGAVHRAQAPHRRAAARLARGLVPGLHRRGRQVRALLRLGAARVPPARGARGGRALPGRAPLGRAAPRRAARRAAEGGGADPPRRAGGAARAGVRRRRGRGARLVRALPRRELSEVAGTAGGKAGLDALSPHCASSAAARRGAGREFWARAGRGAGIPAAADPPVRHYARPDLRVSSLGEGCEGICYAIVQPGRVYAENQEVISALSRRAPWAVIRIRGHAAATVYRVTAPESRTGARAAAAR